MCEKIFPHLLLNVKREVHDNRRELSTYLEAVKLLHFNYGFED